MGPFTSSTYVNFVAGDSAARERLIREYLSGREDFDVIVVGSGVGGGVLADDLADRLSDHQRILLVEAGSFLYPTHVYNVCRFLNSQVAQHFGCDTFWQSGTSTTAQYIGEKPQLNFGGRSIFWSGLIPMIQPWELEFFPEVVRQELVDHLLHDAGERMNQSRSMGAVAKHIVAALRDTKLADDFDIEETPRALHQPYLTAAGTPRDEFFTEPTGVFNTAELLINQLGLTPGRPDDQPGLHLLLNTFVEDVQDQDGQYEVATTNTLTGAANTFSAPVVVLACGSIETPKLLRRSSLFPTLPSAAQALVGRGLTDHPTSDEVAFHVTRLNDVQIPRTAHAKIIFYSKGRRDGQGSTRYPFNVEMNVNHEYWHLRDDDPGPVDLSGPSTVDMKFSFGNCLDDDNHILPPQDGGYIPEIRFGNLSHVDHLKDVRFPAVAGWEQRERQELWDLLNDVVDRIIGPFQCNKGAPQPVDGTRYGQGGKGFGWGTVHHAAGTLRMPWRPHRDAEFISDSVVDEDLRISGTRGVYVCDMSVMPMATAANPVRTLVALALRLSSHLG